MNKATTLRVGGVGTPALPAILLSPFILSLKAEEFGTRGKIVKQRKTRRSRQRARSSILIFVLSPSHEKLDFQVV